MKKLLIVVALLLSSNVNSATFQVTSNGEVGAYFVGSGALYENQVTANFEGATVDAPSISNRGTSGDFYSFGVHNAGEQVVFVDHVVDTNNWFYSIDNFNNDGLRHIQYASFIFEGKPVVLVGFEDILGGGDLDFNDTVVMFTNISAVPEPETYMMLLVGVLLLSLRALKRS